MGMRHWRGSQNKLQVQFAGLTTTVSASVTVIVTASVIAGAAEALAGIQAGRAEIMIRCHLLRSGHVRRDRAAYMIPGLHIRTEGEWTTMSCRRVSDEVHADE